MRKAVLLGVGMFLLLAVGCGRNEGLEETQGTIATENKIETEQEEIGDADTQLLQWELFGSCIDDRPEIMCEDDKIISFLNRRFYYMEPAANGSDYCYGLTFHKQTKEPIYLKDYIPSIQTLIDAIEAEDYTVVYGEFFAMSKEEIIQTCRDYLEEDWDKHYSNFYVDNESLYIIVQGTLSGYTSLKIPKKYINAEWNNKTPFSAGVLEDETELSEWEIYAPNPYDDIKMIHNDDVEMCIEILRPYYNADTANISYMRYRITLNKAMNSLKCIKENKTELALEVDVPDEELSLMQKVLLNKVEFYGMIPSQKSEPGWYKIEDLKGIYGEDDTFGYINLDRIGKKEVFVYYATGDAMIFHEEDNIVYGYPHTYNGFFDVGLNGSFWGMCGWDDYFHYNISFDKHEMRYDYVWLEHDYPTQTNRFWRGEAIKSGYYEDSKIEITEAQFNEIVSTNEDEQLLNLHVFSVENILNYVE